MRKEGIPKRFRDLVGVSVNEDEAVGEPASGVELLGMSCAADSNCSINILTQTPSNFFGYWAGVYIVLDLFDKTLFVGTNFFIKGAFNW